MAFFHLRKCFDFIDIDILLIQTDAKRHRRQNTLIDIPLLAFLYQCLHQKWLVMFLYEKNYYV